MTCKLERIEIFNGFQTDLMCYYYFFFGSKISFSCATVAGLRS